MPMSAAPELQPVEILLAEDAPTDAEMTMRVLKKRGLANHVVWVKDGSEALEFLFRTGSFSERGEARPKLVLLDVKMPKVDGLDVLRRMMEDELLRLIPVVMFTSSAEERDILDCYRLGANSYVVKPMDLDEFDRVVSELGLYWMLLNRTPNEHG
ncbi:MAG TPA: response regulator [Paucimonas sp.]|nr:response regulator [Paucimonas sp.]